MKAEIFVYGSSHYNDSGADSAYGVVVTVNQERIFSKAEGFRNISNCKVIILGLLEGLKQVPGDTELVVYTSDGYVRDTFNKGWLQNWRKAGYKNKKHADLWQEVDKLLLSIGDKVSFKHPSEASATINYSAAERMAKRMSKELQLESLMTSKS